MFERIAITTRSLDDDLYFHCSSLLDRIPVKKLQLKGTSDIGYLEHICSLEEYDWIINIDEDCFIWDVRRLFGLLAYMMARGYVVCGVPDGGVVHHRFHNPLIPNPFFNIFHSKTIREAKVKTVKYNDNFKHYFPIKLMKKGFQYEFDEFERYYGFFFGLMEHKFKFLYLDADEWDGDNNLSTIVKDHNNIPIMIHTWFARQFQVQGSHRHRIFNALEHCKNKKMILDTFRFEVRNQIKDLDVQIGYTKSSILNTNQMILTFDADYLSNVFSDMGLQRLQSFRSHLLQSMILLDLEIERKILLEDEQNV